MKQPLFTKPMLGEYRYQPVGVQCEAASSPPPNAHSPSPRFTACFVNHFPVDHGRRVALCGQALAPFSTDDFTLLFATLTCQTCRKLALLRGLRDARGNAIEKT